MERGIDFAKNLGAHARCSDKKIDFHASQSAWLILKQKGTSYLAVKLADAIVFSCSGFCFIIISSHWKVLDIQLAHSSSDH
jgi:hypothetical protein